MNSQVPTVSTTYNDVVPISATTTTNISSSLNEVSTTLKDYLGRVSETQLTSDPEGTDYVDTTYDTLGRTSTVSNPYRTTSDTTYGITTNQYDALSRVVKVIPQDGTQSANNVTTVYSGNCTTATDETGAARKSCVDGLGRLTGVWEDPNGKKYETDYAYNALGDLVSVTQKGSNSSNARVRTFTYDSLSRFLCAANPEIQSVTCPALATGTFPAGATTYVYDNDGNLSSKTSPAPNQSSASVTVTVNYQYDALNRLIQKTYTGMTMPTIKYGYDAKALQNCTTPPPTLTDNNAVGRRTAMCDGSGATSWSHDPMGSVLQESRTIGSATGANTSYGYNLNESLATLTTPPQNQISYTPGGAGRPLAAVDTGNGINFVTSATYAPFGGLTGMTMGSTTSGTNGSFAGIVTSDVYSARLQPVQLYASSPTGTVFSECYDFHLGVSMTTAPYCPVTASTLGNNGNVYQVANNRDTTRTQSFTYDSLNRIASGQSSGSQWGENYTIDAWGNLYARSGVTGKTYYEPLSTTAPGTSNQLSGYTYDAAGNMTNNGSTSYVYDAENRLIWTSGYGYVYDGDGERVEKCVAATSTTPCPTSGTNGTLYWRGTGSDPLSESDLSGNALEDYIFFNGQRIARRDVSNDAVHFYFSDHLGTHAVVENATGTACEQDIDYYPYGGVEEDYCPNVAQHYKFNGKERDTESGLDNFGARYDASNLGRFMTPDWAAKPTTVPYANFGNPQSLNLYSYVENNPTTMGDPDGHYTQSAAFLSGYGIGIQDWQCCSEGGGGVGVAGMEFWASLAETELQEQSWQQQNTTKAAQKEDPCAKDPDHRVIVYANPGPDPIAVQMSMRLFMLKSAQAQVQRLVRLWHHPVVQAYLFVFAGALGGEEEAGLEEGAEGAETIQFGNDANQVYHTFRHADAAGLDRGAVEGAVRADLQKSAPQIVAGEPFNRTIQVGGTSVTYTAFRLPSGVINVGRITIP